MIYLLTGTPGHGKTQRAIWMLLNDDRFKGRPVLYANVRGLKQDDERLKNWIPLTDIQQWQTAPQGAVIFVDECHQEGFFPLRGVGKPPKWIEDIATHRHLGLDFMLVTQNAKNMDVFIRRLVELHIHCKRPAQMGYTNVYEFQSFTDCDDRIPVDSALRHSRWVFDKSIWTLYESAVENTAKARVPRMVYLVPVFVVALIVLGWYVYSNFQGRVKKVEEAAKGELDSSGKPKIATNSAKSSSSPAATVTESLSRMSPQDRVTELMHRARDFGFALVPVDPSFPETAPRYDDIREVKAFPVLVAAAMQGERCVGYNQQGISERGLPRSTCIDFVQNGRFNPYVDEAKSRESAQGRQPVSAAASGAPGSAAVQRPYLVQQLDGSVTWETRSAGDATTNTPPPIVLPPAAVGVGLPGALGAPGAPASDVRGGYVSSQQSGKRTP